MIELTIKEPQDCQCPSISQVQTAILRLCWICVGGADTAAAAGETATDVDAVGDALLLTVLLRMLQASNALGV